MAAVRKLNSYCNKSRKSIFMMCAYFIALLLYCLLFCMQSCNDLQQLFELKKCVGNEVQFLDSQLQIFNRGDYGCSKFQFFPKL